MTVPDLVSTCCGQPTEVAGTLSQYYVCTGCQRACDAGPPPAVQSEHLKQSGTEPAPAAGAFWDAEVAGGDGPAAPLREPMRSPRGGKQSSRPQARHRWRR